MRIAVVVPSFTQAAYNNAFYPWYVKYEYARKARVPVYAELGNLTGHMLSHTAAMADVGGYQQFADHIKQVFPGHSVALIKDHDVHYNRLPYDILLIWHSEYQSQQMYNNYKQFVANGGILVGMDGNVFYAEVRYNPSADTVTLVKGHGWSFDSVGKVAKADLGERWWQETSGWFGSNSDAGTTTMTWAYLKVRFGYNPIGYPAGKSGAENQYMSNSADKVILDFQSTGAPGKIAVYYKEYGAGRVVSF